MLDFISWFWQTILEKVIKVNAQRPQNLKSFLVNLRAGDYTDGEMRNGRTGFLLKKFFWEGGGRQKQ